MKYATVIIDISHEKVDRGFSYYVPEELSDRIVIGSPVVVPFGRGDTKRTGYVIALSEEAPAGVAPDRIKPVMGLMKGALPIEAQLVALAAWMRAHYGSTMTRALRTVIPIRKKEAPKERKVISSIVSTDRLEDEYTALVSKKRYSKAKERLLSELKRNPGTGLPWELVTGKLMVPSTSIRELERAGIISVDARRSYRNPIDVVLRADTAEDPDKIILNPAQKQVLSEFHRGREEDDRPFLLYGITGSGKTEVYIEMLREVIAEGKQAIVLIPEIALTYQTVMRFYSRFGERVSFLNSRMSPGERYDQYERAKRGELDIMVGPRSALFTAFDNLGLIIIDEEHETSYQSEQPPRYHAREVAEERARLTGATLVLGSATPSLESYSRALEGRYRLLRLTERAVVGATLPTTEIVDLRAELKGGNRSILSRKLQEAIGDRLSRGEQSMLFLNRRGVSGFISCRACGEAIKCPHCDVSLSEHRDGRLHCHYCGYTAPKPGVCPSCGSKHIAGFRVGTEKVEEEVKRLFPKARVLRMDADTTGGKDGHREILSAFSDHEADILVGTQMIVKGHDFGNVTLMGILAADQALNDYDFRSSERCYDLLVQASGRAGRGERPGLVIIQTYKPEHYAITAAAASDYEGFYKQEIAYRDLMGYPPHFHMLTILITGAVEKETDVAAAAVAKRIREYDGSIFMAGPHTAGISKLRDIYRRIVYLKNDDYERLIRIMDIIEPLTRDDDRFKRITIYTDFD